MKLKTLLLTIAVLAVASAIVYFVNRPAQLTSTDPRIGTPLVDRAALEARLGEVQGKLNQLQGKAGETKSLVVSPEVQKAIEDFQKQEAGMRGERREIRRALRENIDRLENVLLVTNLLASPLLVGVFGLWFYRRRRK